MNRIAIDNLSDVRAMARGDMAGTLGGAVPNLDKLRKFLACMRKAKNYGERYRCVLQYQLGK